MLLLTWFMSWPSDRVSIVSVGKFVGGELESEDLVVDLTVRTTAVHVHLRILFLSGQTICHHPASVHSSVSSIPTVLLHRLLASAHLRVLTEDTRQPGPESLGVLHLGDDVSDQGVQAGARHQVLAPVHTGHQLLVVGVAKVNSLSLAQPWLSAILENLKRKIYLNLDQTIRCELNHSCFSFTAVLD